MAVLDGLTAPIPSPKPNKPQLLTMLEISISPYLMNWMLGSCLATWKSIFFLTLRNPPSRDLGIVRGIMEGWNNGILLYLLILSFHCGFLTSFQSIPLVQIRRRKTKQSLHSRNSATIYLDVDHFQVALCSHSMPKFSWCFDDTSYELTGLQMINIASVMDCAASYQSATQLWVFMGSAVG